MCIYISASLIVLFFSLHHNLLFNSIITFMESFQVQYHSRNYSLWQKLTSPRVTQGKAQV